MRHLSDGRLRRLVDEPAGVSDADREHVSTCSDCLSRLAAVTEDAAAVSSALYVDVAVDVDAGWRVLSRSLAGERRTSTAEPVPARRWRATLTSPVIAGVGVLAIVAGAGTAAANDWLQIFQTEHIAPISVTTADLVRLPDLSAYGDLAVGAEPRVRQVADAAAAAAATGLEAPKVGALPQGVTGDPTFRVGNRVRATFTFSVEKAAQTAKDAGEQLPPPPPGLDGATFRLVAGPGLGMVWSDARGVPALVVARAVAPSAYSSDVSFQTASDYLLSLPGLSDNLASQLRSLSDQGDTLPLPLPAGVRTGTADVAGSTATVFESTDGALAGVVWVRDGIVTVVAGTVSDDEALSVARELR
jgi:hypothetical protein